MISARIASLFLSRGPSAVAGLVIAVIVDAVNFVLSGWWHSHVGQKVFNNQPSLADQDASAAISVVIFAGLFGATTDHGVPNLNHSFPRGFGKAMRDVQFGNELVFQATARCSMSRKQIASERVHNRTAITAAIPTAVVSATTGICSDNQPAEPSASEVFGSVVIGDRLNFSHDRSFETRLVRVAPALQRRGLLALYGNSTTKDGKLASQTFHVHVVGPVYRILVTNKEK